jgi:hypothetical protein
MAQSLHDWLSALGCEQYEPAIRRGGCASVQDLAQLGVEAVLAEQMGVTRLFHRRKIWRAIQETADRSAAVQPTTTPSSAGPEAGQQPDGGGTSRRWQHNNLVLAEARANMWPSGSHRLGVHWASGVRWNQGELDRRILAGEFSAAQCLSRLTDGMPNHEGPPNGPGRPTLTTKWRARLRGAPAEEIEAHVAALREHVARRVAQQLGLLPGRGDAQPALGAAAAAAAATNSATNKRGGPQPPTRLARQRPGNRATNGPKRACRGLGGQAEPPGSFGPSGGASC